MTFEQAYNKAEEYNNKNNANVTEGKFLIPVPKNSKLLEDFKKLFETDLIQMSLKDIDWRKVHSQNLTDEFILVMPRKNKAGGIVFDQHIFC